MDASNTCRFLRNALGASTSGPLKAVAAALAACALTACGGHSGSGVPPTPITINVSADPGTIQPGSSAQVTATVSNDPSKSGVTWSVACSTADCGTLSATTTDSGVATTYLAPSGSLTPATDLTVSITATLVSDPTVSAIVKVTVKGSVAITEFDASSATVLAGTTAQVAVKVINDPANRGVSWSVSCATAPCGTVSPSTSASGVYVTYTAPTAVPPADLAVTVTATALSEPSVQASDTLTVPALAVTVGPSGGHIAAGSTSQFTASVNYPVPASQGVAWTVQCGASDCGAISPLTSASGAPVTYKAPATAPPADLTVTVTASSVSAPSVQGSAQINVSPIGVSITPISALMPLNETQAFTGSVHDDPNTGNIAWSLVQNDVPCPSACGAVSPSATANGATVIYTAPATLPANATVALTATSVTDQTKSATATVMLTSGSVKLVPADLWFAKHQLSAVSTLTNTGKSPLTITGVTIGGTNPKSFSQSNTCGSGLAPGASCNITVSYKLASGNSTAVLSIIDSSSDSPQQLHLSTSGAHPVDAAMRTALAGQLHVSAPPPSGDSPVGTREMHLVDSSRTDPYVPASTRRELLVRFWYPAATRSSCVVAPYTSPQVWNYFSDLIDVRLPQVSTHSCLNAPLGAGPYPVVLLTHGFTGTFTDYTFLAEDLASRGYVVAAVDHTHEATAVEFPDGRLETSVFGSHLTQYVRSDAGALGLAVAVRLDDLKFVLNELEQLNAGRDADFTARFDLSRIALAGHSLGGLTTLRALEREPRFKAGVLLDGLMPPHFDKPIQQPLLTLVAGRERWNEDDCRLWDTLRGPRLAVNLPGVEHIALSDAVWLLKGLVSTGNSSTEQAIAALREYVATFLDANLKGQAPGSLLTVPLPDYPGVVATRAQILCGIQ